MKNIILIIALLFAGNINAKHRKMELQKALESKQIKASALSTGGFQGYCIQLNVENMTNDSLILLVEAGRRLISMEEKDQDILITREEIIVLRNKQQKWVPVYGFCCQASNHCPKKNAKYALNNIADTNLAILARYISVNKFNDHIVQQAVWAVSDMQPSAQVNGKKDTMINKLRNLVCVLKREELPWYALDTKTFVYQSGRMENYATLLTGKLNYNISEDSYTTLHVLDTKGREVCQILKQWTLKGNNIYDLELPVKELKKGKYTVELKSEKGTDLAKRNFEI